MAFTSPFPALLGRLLALLASLTCAWSSAASAAETAPANGLEIQQNKGEMTMLRLQRFAVLGTLLIAHAVVLAQGTDTWPSKPVSLIVPFTPGGSTDAEARVYSQKLTENIGKSVVLDARVDPSLLGGMVAQVGSRVFDASLRSRLERLALTLTDPARA